MNYKNYAILQFTIDNIIDWCMFSTTSFSDAEFIYENITPVNTAKLQLIGTDEDIDTMISYTIIKEREV